MFSSHLDDNGADARLYCLNFVSLQASVLFFFLFFLFFLISMFLPMLVQGKVELELEILTKAEAEEKPAGEARDDPNTNPTLDPPK